MARKAAKTQRLGPHDWFVGALETLGREGVSLGGGGGGGGGFQGLSVSFHLLGLGGTGRSGDGVGSGFRDWWVSCAEIIQFTVEKGR